MTLNSKIRSFFQNDPNLTTILDRKGIFIQMDGTCGQLLSDICPAALTMQGVDAIELGQVPLDAQE